MTDQITSGKAFMERYKETFEASAEDDRLQHALRALEDVREVLFEEYQVIFERSQLEQKATKLVSKVTKLMFIVGRLDVAIDSMADVIKRDSNV